MALKASQPVGLPLSSVRPIVVDGGENGAYERAVAREVVVRPGHELPANLNVGGWEVRGPDLHSKEDEVLCGAEGLFPIDCILEWGMGHPEARQKASRS